MVAKFRVGLLMAATAFLSVAAPLRAQDAATEAPANTTETVGPRELQDFNLQGTVTRQAEPTPAPAPTTRPSTSPPAPTTTPRQSTTTEPSGREPAQAERSADTTRRPADNDAGEARTVASARPTVSAPVPQISDAPAGEEASPVDAPPAPATAPPADQVPLSWILAAMAVLAGAGAYWWFNRSRLVTAGGELPVDNYVATPRPAPPAPLSPRIAPIAEPATAPSSVPEPSTVPPPIGIVSTRMRPWLELDIKPLRCSVEADHVAIDVELTIFNSGSLPARAILLEAAMINAGPKQDQDIEYFFSNPVGAGKRASSLAPLKKAVVRSRVITKLKDVQEYEIEGRKVYVPIVAVNALYNWANGEGQTAGAYVVGREVEGEKLAPFRLDRGQAAYGQVARRQLQNGCRE